VEEGGEVAAVEEEDGTDGVVTAVPLMVRPRQSGHCGPL
jgi:hypothetical protein